MEILTPTNILFGITIISLLFSVFLYFKNPQESLEKKQAMDQVESDGKATVLAQQLQWEKEATNRRFTEISQNLKEATSLAQNHIHSISVQVESLASLVNRTHLQTSTKIAELTTIIDERIPKKGRDV